MATERDATAGQEQLLAVLTGEERAQLTARLVDRSYRRGHAVFHDGDVGDCLYLVRSGRFAVVVSPASGLEAIVRVVHPGEFFGELALVHPDHRRTGGVVALGDGRVSILHRRDFDDLRARYPALDRLLVMALAERLKRTTAQLLERALPPAQRVWHLLGELADGYGDDPIEMSQDDLARMAATVRQTVNRALAVAEEAGAVERRRGVIRVIDRAWLRNPPG